MIQCNRCKEQFQPTKKDEALIRKGLERGLRVVLIECPNCASMVNPLEAESNSTRPPPRLFKCPIPACWGDVGLVDTCQPPFWGCGECGTQWASKEELDRSIDEIVSRYPHRKQAYTRTKNGWEPAKKELDGWEELVASEDIGNGLGVPRPKAKAPRTTKRTKRPKARR